MFVCLFVCDELIGVDELCVFLMIVVQWVLSNYWWCEQIECVYFDVFVQCLEVVVLLLEEWVVVVEMLFEIDCLFDGLLFVVKCVFLFVQFDGFMQVEIVCEFGVLFVMVKCYFVKVGMQCFFVMVV